VSCSGIQVSAQGVLSAICGDGQGGFDRASIDMNAHVSNNNGNLVDGAGFAASCQNIRYYELGTDNQGVAAECRKFDQSLGSTTWYNAEARVSNNGGTLVFNICNRSLLEAVDASAIAGRKMLRV